MAPLGGASSFPSDCLLSSGLHPAGLSRALLLLRNWRLRPFIKISSSSARAETHLIRNAECKLILFKVTVNLHVFLCNFPPLARATNAPAKLGVVWPSFIRSVKLVRVYWSAGSLDVCLLIKCEHKEQDRRVDTRMVHPFSPLGQRRWHSTKEL